MTVYTVNPELDLVLERNVDVAPELVWRAWTTPELLVQWFAPKPWTTTSCEMDLQPGGRCNTTMRSPEGDEYPNTGCILAVEEGTRLVFTSAMSEGFRPQIVEGGFPFTAVISIEPDGDGGTKYTATAIHADSSAKKQHEEMGFIEGWGAALDQLVEVAKSL